MITVEILIENKREARDPEGETIMRDLMHANNYNFVKDVRTGKLLRVKIEAANEEEARKKVFQMCNDLRIFNPVAHSCKIEVRGEE